MDNYRVGQVLYMIGEKTTKVLPIQVVEEIIRTTMDGKVKSYIVRLPDKAETTADISEIKGKLFESTTTLREYMTSNAVEAIGRMITNATALRDSVFDYVVQDHERSNILTTESIDIDQLSMFPTVQNSAAIEDAKDDISAGDGDVVKVDLGNGKFGTMRTDTLKKLGQ